MFYQTVNGCSWQSLPHDLPLYRMVFRYFRQWQQDGTLDRLHDTLRGEVRQADIFALFHAAHEARTHFLVRTAADRLAGQGVTTVAKRMKRQPIRGVHEVTVRDDRGAASTARVFVRFCRMTIHPSPAKRKRYGPLSLTVIEAHEQGKPKGREPIRWKLLTDLPVTDLVAAIEKLDWYAMRWKIEIFHKVLKSGCRAELSKLRTAERLTNLLAVLCVVGWRVFWLAITGRVNPAAPPEVAFTPTEIAVLDRVAGGSPKPSERTVAYYLGEVANLCSGFELNDRVVGN